MSTKKLDEIDSANLQAEEVDSIDEAQP